MRSGDDIAKLALQLATDAGQRVAVAAGGRETLDEALMVLARSGSEAGSHLALTLIMSARRSTEDAGSPEPPTRTQVAYSALDDQDYARAERIAAELLAEASEMDHGHWNHDNLVHHAHIIIGRSRLAQGDIDAAESELRAAGEISGSPQLSSFGPDLSLAWELIKLGRAPGVIDYFTSCSVFWSPSERR